MIYKSILLIFQLMTVSKFVPRFHLQTNRPSVKTGELNVVDPVVVAVEMTQSCLWLFLGPLGTRRWLLPGRHQTDRVSCNPAADAVVRRNLILLVVAETAPAPPPCYPAASVGSAGWPAAAAPPPRSGQSYCSVPDGSLMVL